MNRYTKRPVEIEAVQFIYTSEGIAKLIAFAGSAIGDIQKDRHPGAKAEAQIHTLEDGKAMEVAHIATEGDFIIKGVQGEFYACKPDIFMMTYDKVVTG